ncbi:MAG: FG-GAP-like repeat-containing protein, partial [Cyclobacteriaceae bacterium]
AGRGAMVWISTANDTIFQEAYFTRGYQSSVEPVMTTGVGSASVLGEIKVIWPDGRQSIRTQIAPDQVITISQSESIKSEALPPVPNPTLIRDVTASSGLDFIHRENKFIDFKVQRLLYYQVSRLGGKLAKGDVNNDGNDDVFFGGAIGQPGMLYLGRDNGSFLKSQSQPWAMDSIFEDTDALFFDADSDGDADLYVVSGGSEFIPSAPLYQDRLYINDGNGSFTKISDALPLESASGSIVTAADYDKDGDLDLFVGGRIVPGSYGFIPRSYFFQNNSVKGKVKFTDVTLQQEALSNLGMVTCAVWTDYNGDSWPDLIVAGEWMPVKVFENQKGKMIERTDLTSLEKSEGWWCSILPADIDNDGDTDYFLGNAGTNMQFKASPEEPVQLYAWDFNQDGTLDPIVTYFIQGKSYPLATRDELLDQVSSFRKRFIKYEDYASATIDDLGDEDQIEQSYKFSAYVLQSCWMENIGGKDFKLHPLPDLAQVSPINAFVLDDFTGVGKKQIIAAGNFYPFKPQLGRSDASKGLLLEYKNGISVANGVLSDVWLEGDIRDMELLNFKSGIRRILVSRNNDKASVYAVSIRQ